MDIKNESYIEYFTASKRKETKFDLYKISFTDLWKNRNCIDWILISNNVTKETCTRDFYTKFTEYLNWYNGNFLKFVDEDYLLQKIDDINISNLTNVRNDFSEDFCIKVLKKNEHIGWKNDIFIIGILTTQKYTFSSEFLEEKVFKKYFVKDNDDENKYSRNYYNKEKIANEISKNQKITEDQYTTYVETNFEFFKKFLIFVILSNPMNNFSKEFIMKHKKDLNQKSFFNTQQAIFHLTTNRISDAALEIFKSKINYVTLINECNNIENISYMAPFCKKEFFNVFTSQADKIKNPEKLNELRKLFV